VTVAGDVRMTRVGRFLERSKLDELPQLWNILLGEMSFVGPRPESLRYQDLFQAEFARVLDFKPGIFGPNQVAFRNESGMYPSRPGSGRVLPPGVVPRQGPPRSRVFQPGELVVGSAMDRPRAVGHVFRRIRLAPDRRVARADCCSRFGCDRDCLAGRPCPEVRGIPSGPTYGYVCNGHLVATPGDSPSAGACRLLPATGAAFRHWRRPAPGCRQCIWVDIGPAPAARPLLSWRLGFHWARWVCCWLCR
jgi:hypothetical protein